MGPRCPGLCLPRLVEVLSPRRLARHSAAIIYHTHTSSFSAATPSLPTAPPSSVLPHVGYTYKASGNGRRMPVRHRSPATPHRQPPSASPMAKAGGVKASASSHQPTTPNVSKACPFSKPPVRRIPSPPPARLPGPTPRGNVNRLGMLITTTRSPFYQMPCFPLKPPVHGRLHAQYGSIWRCCLSM